MNILAVRQTQMHTAELLLPEPTSCKVEIAIDKQKRYKSPGIDQNLPELIQARGNTLCSEIHELINCICNKEELPQQWKESIIVSIYKKGDETDCNNYRKISLLLSTYKILSNIVKRLTPYVNESIADYQCEFRCNRSTTDQVFCVCQILEKK
jgi:hypothetical protein